MTDAELIAKGELPLVCTKNVYPGGWRFQPCSKPAKWLIHGGVTPRCGIHARKDTHPDRRPL